MKMLRTLCASLLLLLAAPTLALAAEAKQAEDQVTLAMFVLIIAIVAILAILVAFENRKGKKH